jgi:hypothetical protein
MIKEEKRLIYVCTVSIADRVDSDIRSDLPSHAHICIDVMHSLCSSSSLLLYSSFHSSSLSPFLSLFPSTTSLLTFSTLFLLHPFSSPFLFALSLPLSLSSRPSGAVNQNEFGKYGVIRDESFFAKQR